MYYGDKKEAMVKIMVELVSQGWKVFGYRADESDSMTDYYSPAYWNGLATKNGYVLVIDNYNTHYSAYEKKEYNYNNDSTFNTSDKISKLTAKMKDPASTPNEKIQCARLIERQQERQASKTSEKVIEVYPTFLHGNPKNCSWHIEKDGQIIAKGTGIFACNDYDWENKELSSSEQKHKKVLHMVKRFEAAIKQDSALESEVIQVAKTVTKPVLKVDNTINVNDILSFSYHGHFWIVTSVYQNSKNETCVVYELLGSEKRGYQRTLHGKRYYQPLKRLEKEMEEGKTKVYTLQEVIEYIEKTIYNKTAKKVKQDLNTTALTGEVEEVTETPEVAQQASEPKTSKTEKVNNSNEQTLTASFQLNSVKNGIEIKFSDKPSKGIIEVLKENGFRWFQPLGFWCAKQTAERLTFATMICETYNSTKEEVPTQEAEQQEETAQEVAEEATESPAEEVKKHSYDFEIDFNYLYHDIHFKAWNDSEETLSQLLDHKNINYYISGEKFICEGLTMDEVLWCIAANKKNQAIIFYDDKYDEPKQTDNSDTLTTEQTNNVTDFQEYKDNMTGSENELTENYVNMFDDIEIKNSSRISSDDQEFCEHQEKLFNEALTILSVTLTAMEEIYSKYKTIDSYYKDGYLDDYKDIRHITSRVEEVKNKFIDKICRYFENKYQITIEKTQLFAKKFENKKLELTHQNILDEIFEQLGGFTFKEKAVTEIKEAMKNLTKSYHGESRTEIKNNKIIFEHLYLTRFDSIWKEYRFDSYGENKKNFFKALSNFDHGSTETHWKFDNFYNNRNEKREDIIFAKNEINLNKVKYIKLFKNGKVEVEFDSNQSALQFAKEYCNHIEKSSKTA